MAISEQARTRIEHVADRSLSAFRTVGDAARALRDAPSSTSADALATINTFNSARVIQSLAEADAANRESNQRLSDEPAIARVVVADAKGNQSIYYICRATPVVLPDKSIKLASYRSPMGRLASLPLGADFTLRISGETVEVEVVERAELHPALDARGWDSLRSVLQGTGYGPVTVDSFRALLQLEKDVGDVLAQILAEETRLSTLVEGRRRSVILKMGLRDQPVLDQHQDAIFRLPLSSRLFIQGPAGTGKTTTLIRRLGQKLDRNYLEPDEVRAIERAAGKDTPAHGQSWLMFTPTELLKLHIKEAFAREDIPASDQRVRTWSDYRHELGRSALGVLRTSTGGGIFVLREPAAIITSDTLERQIEWFDDFDAWQAASFWQDLATAAKTLQGNSASDVAVLGRTLVSLVTKAPSAGAPELLATLVERLPDVRKLADRLQADTDSRIRQALNVQLSRNHGFVDELAGFISGLAAVDDEGDDPDGEPEQEAPPAKTSKAAAVSAYGRAVSAQARAAAAKRDMGRTSRSALIADWLGDRSLPEADRLLVGESLLLQSAARRFVSPVRRYIDGMPARYRNFRRQRQGEGKWYNRTGFAAADLHGLELDVILLAVLRAAGALITDRKIAADLDATAWTPLHPVRALYRNQILVDEATDFSPIQLAAMASMANPAIRSFVACGDFNQRITLWGARTLDEMKWAVSGIALQPISAPYRQSDKLNELAKSLAALSSGQGAAAASAGYTDNEGFPPVAARDMADPSRLIPWLADRITEIETSVGTLPSIAIFVTDEDRVGSVSEALNQVLAAKNIRVVACRDGHALGQDNDVRVFNVDHIKGLEFEAVFFLGVDALERKFPELFDKYLYVGTTRAATYLGLTFEGPQFPLKIRPLEPLFGATWKLPA